MGAMCWSHRRNYLRVRGEYIEQPQPPHSGPELPPRARRILFGPSDTAVFIGTTSACAENTVEMSYCGRVNRNYLRVRGEYLSRGVEQLANEELPPRARRILW